MQTRIKGYSFTISEPFAAGQVITKGEAQALNTLRTENICNSLRKLVNDELAILPPNAQISQHRLDAIQAKIAAYDANYQFLEKHTPRPRLSDIDSEAIAIARERVEAQLRQSGAEAEPERVEEFIEAQAKLPSVQEEARERVAARRRSLADSLADLVE